LSREWKSGGVMDEYSGESKSHRCRNGMGIKEWSNYGVRMRLTKR